MPKIDIAKLPVTKGSGYPSPLNEIARERTKIALGDAVGLTDFGVNLTRLPPGEWSSQRHWHTHEDELVYVISGEVVLVTNKGEEILRAGDVAAFPKMARDGHHLINRSTRPATYLEVGTRSESDICTYPDADLHFDPKNGWYTHKSGAPYPKPK